MKVLVIGLGSMGKRRIRLIRQYDALIEIACVDTDKERREQVKKMYGAAVYEDLALALECENPDCCFIATPPLSHAVAIQQCLAKQCHVFTELNLVTDRYDENMALAKKKGVVLFLSSTQLYRNEIQYIKSRVQRTDEKCNYIYHVGQYLPDWHPWESYRDFFVGERRTNACREIMAIEFPWLTDCFGKLKTTSVWKGKNSKLDINYNDSYMVFMEHENGSRGVFCIDILCRIPSRFLEIYNEEIYMKWEGTPESLCEYKTPEKALKQVLLYDRIDQLEGYNETIIENDYYAEVEEFFESVKGNATPRYSFLQDMEILGWIDEIEKE